MRGLFEGARPNKSGQELPCELFEGTIFQGREVIKEIRQLYFIVVITIN